MPKASEKLKKKSPSISSEVCALCRRGKQVVTWHWLHSGTRQVPVLPEPPPAVFFRGKYNTRLERWWGFITASCVTQISSRTFKMELRWSKFLHQAANSVRVMQSQGATARWAPPILFSCCNHYTIKNYFKHSKKKIEDFHKIMSIHLLWGHIK